MPITLHAYLPKVLTTPYCHTDLPDNWCSAAGFNLRECEMYTLKWTCCFTFTQSVLLIVCYIYILYHQDITHSLYFRTSYVCEINQFSRSYIHAQFPSESTDDDLSCCKNPNTMQMSKQWGVLKCQLCRNPWQIDFTSFFFKQFMYTFNKWNTALHINLASTNISYVECIG